MSKVVIDGLTYMPAPKLITVGGLTYRLCDETDKTNEPPQGRETPRIVRKTSGGAERLPASISSAECITSRRYLNGKGSFDTREAMTFGRMARAQYQKTRGRLPYVFRDPDSQGDTLAYLPEDMPILDLAYQRFVKLRQEKGAVR